MLKGWGATTLALCWLLGCSAKPKSAQEAGAGRDATPESDARVEDSGVPIARPYVKAGSRLKIYYVESDGGTRYPTGFFDSKEMVPCWFFTPDAKTLRCMPTSTGSTFYTDSNCTNAVVRREICAGDGDGKAQKYYVLGALVRELGAIQEVPMLFSKAMDGRCSMASNSPQHVQPIGAEVSIERFVKGERRMESIPGYDDFTMSYTYGEDGSSLAGGLNFNGEPCEVRALHAGDAYCVPQRTAQASADKFESADCTGPWLAHGVAPGTDNSPLIINYWETDAASGCERITGYRELGEQATPRSSKFQDTCTPVGAGGTDSYYRQGKVLEESHFPRLKIVDMGAGRLRWQAYVASDGRVVSRAFGWRDTTLNFECEMARSADGVLRCLPADVSRTSYRFSDAKCMQPIMPFRTCQPLDSVRYTVDVRGNPKCPSVEDVTVRSVIPYSGPIYRDNSNPPNVGCIPVENEEQRYFQLGAPLGDSSLATFEYVAGD